MNKYQLERSQRRKLQHILNGLIGTDSLPEKHGAQLTSENFSKTYSVTQYADWQEKIVDQMQGEKANSICHKCTRYQPTSGSTDVQKWIPYSKELLKEFEEASSPWLFDLYLTNKSLFKSKQYWSLSWLPDDQRDSTENLNESGLFSTLKGIMLKQIFIVPESISFAKTDHDAMLATACFLCAERDLSLISVWSPSFALNLLDIIFHHKSFIGKVLATGEWGDLSESLSTTKAPKSAAQAKLLPLIDDVNNAEFWRLFWPNLTVVSCWDTALSSSEANRLKNIFSHANLQGKGLWSTESVISIPVGGKYPLAYLSHFYEFECKETQVILPAWKLEKGMQVIPIVTTGSGLIRYKNNDLVEVVDFYGDVPCFKFLGRLGHTDFVGEKLSNEFVLYVIKSIEKRFQLHQPISLLACNFQQPKYILILGGEDDTQAHLIQQELTLLLRKSFHYSLARDLNQLGGEEVVIAKNAYQKYLNMLAIKGMIKGQIKVEPITLINKVELLDIFYEH